jgi:hypothetical protein
MLEREHAKVEHLREKRRDKSYLSDFINYMGSILKKV